MSDSPFASFWWGGFECTDQLNCFGERVDFLPLTGHLQLLDADYAALPPLGIRTVREGIRWAHIEKMPYHYDWSTVQTMLDAGQRHGIQQVWDLCHFGYPDDLTPLHPLFAQRPEAVLIVTPINEVSFISWLSGDVKGTAPYCHGQGWDVKYGLMRAYIEGSWALREADPAIRFLSAEPLVSIVAPSGANGHRQRQARTAHDNQFQTTDILCGRRCPELGGHPDLLDLVGFNYYYDNQWQLHPHTTLGWNDDRPDPRWKPLRALLKAAHGRYNRPFALTETSHPGLDRPAWLRMIGRECAAVRAAGLPLLGTCLYPIIDRPDWDHLHHWHHSGLWDADETASAPGLTRRLHEPSLVALHDAQALVLG